VPRKFASHPVGRNGRGLSLWLQVCSLLLGDIESSELVRVVCGLSESLCRCPTGSIPYLLPLGKVGDLSRWLFVVIVRTFAFNRTQGPLTFALCD
jgi:hypothetical protein